MTNREIIQIYEGIVEIYTLGLQLDIETNYTLVRIKVLLEPYYKAIILTRQDLMKQYKNPNDETFTSVNMQNLAKEFDQLMDIKVDLDLPKIELIKLNDPKLRIDLLEKLLPIIKS